jgi:hypothetical protein
MAFSEALEGAARRRAQCVADAVAPVRRPLDGGASQGSVRAALVGFGRYLSIEPLRDDRGIATSLSHGVMRLDAERGTTWHEIVA